MAEFDRQTQQLTDTQKLWENTIVMQDEEPEFSMSEAEYEAYMAYQQQIEQEVAEENLSYNPDLCRVFVIEFTSRSAGRVKKGPHAGEKRQRRDREVSWMAYEVHPNHFLFYPIKHGEVRSRTRHIEDPQPDQIAESLLTHIPHQMERTQDKLLEIARRNTENMARLRELRELNTVHANGKKHNDNPFAKTS